MTGKTTFKIDGVTYQVRRNQCGNDCKTCRDDGGHVAFYKYTPARPGEPRGTWEYFGTKPPVPTGAPAPSCKREGCTNPTPRHGQKYCSAKCRVAANRASK